MHMNAYGCIWMHSRYYVLGTRYQVHTVRTVHTIHAVQQDNCTVHVVHSVHNVHTAHSEHTVHTVHTVHAVHTVPYCTGDDRIGPSNTNKKQYSRIQCITPPPIEYPD